MYGLKFEQEASVVASNPYRMDIACFVGFVSRRPDARVPAEVRAWIEHHVGSEATAGASVDDLLDVPVPIDSWEVFDALFRWESREPANDRPQVSTYLGAAVRSFFAQGGRKCYVVRAGDSAPLQQDAPTREAMLRKLIPGFPNYERAVSAVERRTWSGAAHVLGLADVAFLHPARSPRARRGATPAHRGAGVSTTR